MSRLRRHAKPLIVVVALGALAVFFSACAYFKPGTLTLSQPGGVGSAKVHVVLCSVVEIESEACGAPSETAEVQSLLGIAAPPGATPPATITAVPIGGGSPLVFTRNDEVTTELTAASANMEKLAKESEIPIPGAQAWPPAGLQGFGYLSAPYQEKEGVAVEWNLDAEFGLPVPVGGGAFGGPFATGLASGTRAVNPAQPGSRPVHCWRIESEPQESEAFCVGTAQQGQIGTSDLKIAAPKQTSVFLGGKAKLSFPFNFATTATPSPSFALKASSTLPKAQLKVGNPTFTPGPPNPTTHLSPTAPQTVTVTAPKNAKPGTYEVTVTATTPQGGSVSQVAKLKVAKAKIGLGGVTLNKGKGTATLSVKIPGAGTLTATGKGIVKAKKSAKSVKKPKTLKLTIKAKGKAKKLLAEEGTAKVSAKVTFKPSSGVAVTRTKKITLKQN